MLYFQMAGVTAKVWLVASDSQHKRYGVPSQGNQWIRKVWSNKWVIFTRGMLASASISCHHVSVCLSVCLSVHLSITSWCSTDTAKHRIMQTMPHNNPGTVVFCFWKSRQNSNRVTPSGGAKCRWSSLNAGAVAEIGDFQREALST